MNRHPGLLVAILAVVSVSFVAGADNGSSANGRSKAKHGASAPGEARQRGTEHPVLRKVASFELPGPPGKRFDYLTIIPERRLLLSTHLGAGRLYVIDLAEQKVVSTIEDVPGIEAVAIAPDVNKAYTSDWGEHKVGVIDLREMKIVKKIPVGNKPDGIAYAAPFHKMYVSDERGKAEVVIDVARDELVKTLRFDSETGVPQYDPIGKRVLVNLQDQNRIAEIDPSTDKVVASYAVGECQGNHGMALDPGTRRAFLACEGNDLMTVFDLEKHKVLTSLPMAKGADVVQFDPGLGRIYVACASGAISVFQQDDADHYRKLGDVPVERKVHSIAVDSRTHRVYAPEEQERGVPVARMAVYEAEATRKAGNWR